MFKLENVVVRQLKESLVPEGFFPASLDIQALLEEYTEPCSTAFRIRDDVSIGLC
jgi:hypothetical protein